MCHVDLKSQHVCVMLKISKVVSFSEKCSFFVFSSKCSETKKNRGEILVNFPVVACLDLSYMSESRGFGFYQI